MGLAGRAERVDPVWRPRRGWTLPPSTCPRAILTRPAAFFDLDPIVYYREGCARDRYGANWESSEDHHFKRAQGGLFLGVGRPNMSCHAISGVYARLQQLPTPPAPPRTRLARRETAAHEFGHSILRASPPSWVEREWFGIIPLSVGQSWSWTHKGTSSIYQARARLALGCSGEACARLGWRAGRPEAPARAHARRHPHPSAPLQNVLASAPTVPATGDWDLMLYYNGAYPAGAYDRSFATEDDVRRLVGIAEVKRRRLRGCSCPKY